MIERPTIEWRQDVLQERQAVAAGTLSPDALCARRGEDREALTSARDW